MKQSFVKRDSSTTGLLTAVIVLIVLASICAAILIVMLVSYPRSAKRMTGRAKLDRRVSQLSEKSFSSPDAQILMTISEPIHQHKGSPFLGGRQGLPSRPNRPMRPWGEDIPSEPVPSTRVPPKRRLSTVALVKAFSMRRSQYSMHSQPSPPIDRSFVLPTVRTLAAPKKAFVRDRTRKASPVNAGNNGLPDEDKNGYRPLPRRPPFRMPHPFPVSVHGPPDTDGDVAPGELLPL